MHDQSSPGAIGLERVCEIRHTSCHEDSPRLAAERTDRKGKIEGGSGGRNVGHVFPAVAMKGCVCRVVRWFVIGRRVAMCRPEYKNFQAVY